MRVSHTYQHSFQSYQNESEKSPTNVSLSLTKKEPSPLLNWFNKLSPTLLPPFSFP